MNAPTTETTDTAELVCIVYSSVSTIQFSEMDLAGLLMTSRTNNTARGLTGMLLHRGNEFMQALEGPRAAVRSAFATIAADARHTAVWMLDEETITQRRFGSWAMGYRPGAAGAAGAAQDWFGSAEADLTGAEGRRRVSASKAKDLLTRFREQQ